MELVQMMVSFYEQTTEQILRLKLLSGTTINNNADNRVITGGLSTANTLEAVEWW